MSNDCELWLNCGSDVQVFASAARVLAEARIGIDGVDRQMTDGNVTVKIILSDPSQAKWAEELLTNAGIEVV